MDTITSLIVGLLGGGALVQLISTLLHARQNARQLNANALGTEVQALESAISTLRENLEAETQRHERERKSLKERIDELEQQVELLEKKLAEFHLRQSPLQAIQPSNHFNHA